MTRLIPPSRKWSAARRYPSRRPASALVVPSGDRSSSAAEDPAAVPGGRGLQDDPGVGSVADDRDRVTRPELVDQDRQGALDQLQAVLPGHRARRVDDERECRVRALAARDVPGLDADPDQDLAVREERSRAAVGVDAEDAVFRGRVALVEGVDELLHADRGRVRQVAVVHVPPRDGVGRRVHVQRERGLAVPGRRDVRVGARILEGDPVVGRGCRVIGRGVAGASIGRGRAPPSRPLRARSWRTSRCTRPSRPRGRGQQGRSCAWREPRGWGTACRSPVRGGARAPRGPVPASARAAGGPGVRVREGGRRGPGRRGHRRACGATTAADGPGSGVTGFPGLLPAPARSGAQSGGGARGFLRSPGHRPRPPRGERHTSSRA